MRYDVPHFIFDDSEALHSDVREARAGRSSRSSRMFANSRAEDRLLDSILTLLDE
jgi:hypothetical protein